MCCVVLSPKSGSIRFLERERGHSEDSKADRRMMVKQEESPGFREGAADDDRSIELVLHKSESVLALA